MATVKDPYEFIRDAVIGGEFKPGSLLSESALAERIGTSRTPIREALQRLETERLLERRGRSVAVREVSPSEILDIYEVRTSLEGAAAAKAAERANDLDLMRLTNARDAMQAITTDDPKLKASVNRRFHEALWEAGHSPTLVDLLSRINSYLLLASQTTLQGHERWKAALAEHDNLLKAIKDRDAERARRLAEDHMIAARDVRLRFYAGE